MSTGVKHLSSAGFQKARDKPGEVKHGADTPRMVSAGHGDEVVTVGVEMTTGQCERQGPSNYLKRNSDRRSDAAVRERRSESDER
ncbi:uncharacterized, partial [Tachysurus ichikawai]